MEIQLLQHGNKHINRIIAILLCAGEGTRIKDIFPSTPKTLIKIKALNDISILDYLLSNLLNLKIDLIEIITGYLGSQIETHFTILKKSDKLVKEKVNITNSGTDYKKGSFFSFLSISKKIDNYNSNDIFLIFPGDTIFTPILLKNVLQVISSDYELFHKYPVVFYQQKKGYELKQSHKNLISILETYIEKENTFLKELVHFDVNSKDITQVKKVVPIVSFPYNVINQIIKDSKKMDISSIRELINFLNTSEHYKFLAYKLNPNYEYYDIDTNMDLIKLKKKGGQ